MADPILKLPLIIPNDGEKPSQMTQQPVCAVAPGGNAQNPCVVAPADKNLAVLLAGPIVRRATPEAVWVWVATSFPLTVTGRVLKHGGDPSADPSKWTALGTGTAGSLKLGDRLYLTLVTIRASGAPYPRGTLLGYDLTFQAQNGFEFTDNSGLVARKAITYGKAALPMFSLGLGEGAGIMNLVHASCRKLHGPGDDAYEGFDKYLESVAGDVNERPSALLLTGDQIYADDVDPAISKAITAAAKKLMGYDERLPDGSYLANVAGKRGTILRAEGFTVDASVGANHLLTFGEISALYLFSWSQSLWDHPDFVPMSMVFGKRPGAAATRRIFANVPCYMIMDDHEITDDWPITSDMRDIVGGGAHASLVVANGMATCWAFQLWGNADGKGGSAAPPFLAPLQAYITEEARLPQKPSSAELAALAATRKRYIDAVRGVRGYTFVAPTVPPVVLMDTRTQRDLHASTSPGLLNGAGFAELQTAINSAAIKPDMPLLLVSPAPIIGYAPAEEKLKPEEGKPLDFGNDPEAWSYDGDAYLKLLRLLQGTGRRVIVFSGDVHYSYFSVARFTNRKTGAQAAPQELIQLTSSALSNQPLLHVRAALFIVNHLRYEKGVPAEDGQFLEVSEANKTPRTIYESERRAAFWSSLPSSKPGVQVTPVADLTARYYATEGKDLAFASNNFGVVSIRWGASKLEVTQQIRGASKAGNKVIYTS